MNKKENKKNISTKGFAGFIANICACGVRAKKEERMSVKGIVMLLSLSMAGTLVFPAGQAYADPHQNRIEPAAPLYTPKEVFRPAFFPGLSVNRSPAANTAILETSQATMSLEEIKSEKTFSTLVESQEFKSFMDDFFSYIKRKEGGIHDRLSASQLAQKLNEIKSIQMVMGTQPTIAFGIHIPGIDRNLFINAMVAGKATIHGKPATKEQLSAIHAQKGGTASKGFGLVVQDPEAATKVVIFAKVDYAITILADLSKGNPERTVQLQKMVTGQDMASLALALHYVYGYRLNKDSFGIKQLGKILDGKVVEVALNRALSQKSLGFGKGDVSSLILVTKYANPEQAKQLLDALAQNQKSYQALEKRLNTIFNPKCTDFIPGSNYADIVETAKSRLQKTREYADDRGHTSFPRPLLSRGMTY